MDPGVDAAGEGGVLHQPGALAGIIGQSFADSGGLNPAVVHLKDQGVLFPMAGLDVQPAVEAKAQGLFQPLESRLWPQSQKLFDLMGFKGRKSSQVESLQRFASFMP